MNIKELNKYAPYSKTLLFVVAMAMLYITVSNVYASSQNGTTKSTANNTEENMTVEQIPFADPFTNKTNMTVEQIPFAQP